MEEPNWEAEGTFDERIDSVLAAIEGLARVLESDDESAAILASAQVRRALEVAERSAVAIGVLHPERHPNVAAAVQAVQETAQPLLERVPARMYGYATVRRFLARFRADP
jgi:hypothetical protein